MKKYMVVQILIVCLLLGMLTGCKNTQPEQPATQTTGTEDQIPEDPEDIEQEQAECEHIWQEATCTQAKLCSRCGTEDAEALGHSMEKWYPNGNGTHGRGCALCDMPIETADCFAGQTPQDGQKCEECGYLYEKSHSHAYDQQVTAALYRVAVATCTQKASYYYSCKCGAVGTNVFYVEGTVAHKPVIDPAKQATFSNPGLTEGTHCDVCGTVLQAQTTIPALGSDVAVGTDYYDKNGQTTYRYSYSFTLFENDRFSLTTLKLGSDESFSLYTDEGKINYLDNGVYELVFDNGKEKMYGKIDDGSFQFCNKDGSKWKDKDIRPQGATTTKITPRPGNSIYGYEDLSRNNHGKSMQELYYRMYAACEALVDDSKNITATNGKYIFDRINLDYYVLTANEAIATWKVFLVENPRYYWLSNTVSVSGGILEMCVDAAYADGAYRVQCDASINAMASACAGNLTADMSQLEKTLAIHDFILRRMNYAYQSDGKTPQNAIWAHNMVGSAEKKSGVCESYAKTYQYLCRLNGLECIIVTGYNGENHAWNMVKIDGKWYGVDCTFDETNNDTISYSCFGMDAERMNSEYSADTPSDGGVNYLYKLPSLATQEIELVDLYKNGTKVGTYLNIDAAFAAMTDTGADYEVGLYLYERKGILLMSSASVEHHINETKTPAVKSVTIRGNYFDLNGEYNTCSILWINKKLQVNCDLTISDLNVYGEGALDLKGNTLTCQGQQNQVQVPVKGSMDANDPSQILINTQNGGIEFWDSVEVYNFRCVVNAYFYTVTLRADCHFVNLHTDSVYIYDSFDTGICIDIDNLYPLGNKTYDISIYGAAVVNVDNIVTGNRDYVAFQYSFAKNESVPKVTVKNTQCPVYLYLIGKTTTITTDLNGNVIDTEIKVMDYSTLTSPVMYFVSNRFFADMQIYLCDDDNYLTYLDPQTEKFQINSQNQVVWKG